MATQEREQAVAEATCICNVSSDHAGSSDSESDAETMAQHRSGSATFVGQSSLSDYGLLSTDGHRAHTEEISVPLVNEIPAVVDVQGFQEHTTGGLISKEQIVIGTTAASDKIKTSQPSPETFSSYNITSKGGSIQESIQESNPGDSSGPRAPCFISSDTSNLEDLIKRIVDLKLSTAQFAERSEVEQLRKEHHVEVELLKKEIESCHNEIHKFKQKVKDLGSDLAMERDRRECAEQLNKFWENKVRELEEKNKQLQLKNLHLQKLLSEQLDSSKELPVKNEPETLYFQRL